MWARLFLDQARREEATERFDRSANIDDFNSRYDDLSNQPLSDWDLHIYAILFFDDDDSEGTPNGPYLWCAPTVRDFHAMEFWRWMVGAVPPDEVDRIHQWATDVNRHQQWVPEGDLVDPRFLVEGP